MGDSNDFKAFAEALKSLQASVAANAQAIASLTADRTSASGHKIGYGEHHGDRPPRFQKLDFPRYDGKTDPLIFINRCESYFHQQRIMEEEKVWMASYNLEHGAQMWYIQVQTDEGTPSWRRFKELLNLRYGPPLRAAPLFELADCRRTGSVADYQDRFQALLPRAGPLDEAQRVQLFTGGLRPPLSLDVQVHNPQSLAAAMSLARQLELREQYTSPPPKGATRGLLPTPAPRLALPAPPAEKAATPAVMADGRKRLSMQEQEERRRQGLCFNCNERYTRGHNRVCTRIFYINGVELDTADESATGEDPDTETPVFSLHAVAGVLVGNTVQLQVIVGAATFVALIDTGSTHSFIGETAARRSGLTIEPRPRLTATVANGERVACPGVLRNAPIDVGGMVFGVDLFVMPLAGYDVVLGTHWMATLGPIVWDFTARTMAFQWEGRDVCWRDGAPPSTPTLLAATTDDTLIDGLLHAFADVFTEPIGLPPARGREHHIVLKPGSSPVAVRPYRYPAAHKDELERQCAAMIDQGIVRRSDSAFSSPVILVKKLDGSWRFCVDYRALNALTVKDAFPIPVVDELLDELHGARLFTKLDLRSGYHQVRMRQEDVHKTAFRTHDGLYEFLVMPFGLCNAPATFQALMNDVLRPFLRRFVLVFFDDILIYSKSWGEHLRHLRAVLEELQRHQLFLKRTKCAFGATKVGYLGHVISEAGVAMDPAKVQAIRDWPTPRSARAVRGFLGLTGYYRKFVHHYGTVAAPLTALLKKDGFSWSAGAAEAFVALKDAVTSAPVLTMPDFSKPFVVECDASSHGFGAVMVQGGHPIAFFSRAVAPRHQALAAYERELIGLVLAVRHWRPYLWGRRFIVKTDHYSLKYLLDQRLATLPQHHWVGKLLGFDFSVEYKPGSTNVVADALSRRDTPDDGALLALSAPRFDVLDRLRQAQLTDPALTAIRDEVQAGTKRAPWEVVDGMVQYAGRLYLPPSSPLLRELLAAVHAEGHEGVQRTLHRLRRDFHFPNMKQVVQDYVRECPTCQRHKSEHLHPAGLLLPLPIPQGVWTDVALDFVEALPRVRGKSVILTVVDRFSKYCHFIPLAHPYSAESVAQAFFAEIVRLHGVPQSLVSDRDVVFTSKFWKEIMRLMGTSLHMTSAFHPQSDGQSESANRVIIMYLRCLTSDRPRQWLQWLPWAEYVFNTAYQSSLRDTPFKIVYGREPPSIRSYEPGDTRVAAVARTMEEREEFLADVRHRLEQAQAVQKKYYDQGHRAVTYQVGEWVLLRLRHRSPASLATDSTGKLKPRFYGPYRVLELINEVAVRLELPARARIHDVFHVGVLKKYHGTPPQVTPPLPPLHHGAVTLEPARAIRTRLNRGVRQVLVQWKDQSPASATWEDMDTFTDKFPTFQLEDELLLEERRDVMYGHTYARRRRARDVRRAEQAAKAHAQQVSG